jgi:hypothetical protein
MDFICYTVVYGACPFINDPVVKRVLQSSLVTIKGWGKDPYVYQFSTSSRFRGIISTFSDLSLIGHGYARKGEGWDKTKQSLVFLALKRFSTQSSWYKAVSDDCRRQVVCWMRPISRYSPISNLVKMSKKALVLDRTQVPDEDGSLIANIARVSSRAPKGAKFDAWEGTTTKEVSDEYDKERSQVDESEEFNDASGEGEDDSEGDEKDDEVTPNEEGDTVEALDLNNL